MTKKEAAQILAILKAAYPNSYKNMTTDEANGTATIWSIQLGKFPANVVFIAINKWISKNPFPPAISEVIQQIDGLYWEVWSILKANEKCNTLTQNQLDEYKQIFEVTKALHSKASLEPTLTELTDGGNQYLLLDNKGVK